MYITEIASLDTDLVISEGLFDKIKPKLLKLKAALSTETAETKQMVDIYRRAMKKQASPQEIATANTQLRDLLKLLGLGVLAALPVPGAALLIVAIEKFVSKYGMSIMPSALAGN
jgi:hypothetical protein